MNRPSAQVAVTLADESTVLLEFGKESADEKVYSVAGFHRDRFTRGWDSFKVIEPPPNMLGGDNPWADLDPETLKILPPEVRQRMQHEQPKQRLMQQLQAQQAGASK